MIDHEAWALEMTGPCTCDTAYTSRKRQDPQCQFHGWADDIAAYGRAVEREARLQALQDCLDIIAAERNDYFNKTQGA